VTAIARLRALPASQVRLLAGVCAVQVAIGTTLRLVPLPWLRRMVHGVRPLARRRTSRSEHEIGWAIEAVGRRLPGLSTCFVRALAADLLLQGGDIRIGVRRTAAGALESHAWFERDGRAIVGGSGAGFVPFTTLPPASRHG
jgi:hypothetical protein